MQTRPKKSLGQNFLIDKNIQSKMIAACSFGPRDEVIEIGAGMGAITAQVAGRVSSLYAIEIDRSLCALLEGLRGDFPGLHVINGDFLKYDLSGLLDVIKGKARVIGNIPYYITTPIIQKLFEHRDRIADIFLTVQKELGERIVASAGSRAYGALSCFVQYHAKTKLLFTVKNTCFFPRPKVDSCFLRMELRGKPLLGPEEEGQFFRFVRASFGKRRKMLKNSLKGLLPDSGLEALFSHARIDPRIRPEELGVEEFIKLIKSQKKS